MKHCLNIIITAVLLLSAFSLFGQEGNSLKDKARLVIRRLKAIKDYPNAGRDTLIDLNGDHFKDILIEYYGFAGSGEKNRVRVYLYDHIKKEFIASEQLNALLNPTFYPDKKMVVGYYLGNGGGDATKMKWNGLTLDTLEHINISVIRQDDNTTFKLDSFNYLTISKASKVLKEKALPGEYNYFNYQSVIKANKQ